MSQDNLSEREARIVKALNQFADDLAAGAPLESKLTIRQVRVIPKPSSYPPGASTGRPRAHWGQPGSLRPVVGRQPDDGPILGARFASAFPMARRFLDEIEMSPEHFQGRILDAAVAAKPTGRTTKRGVKRHC